MTQPINEIEFSDVRLRDIIKSLILGKPKLVIQKKYARKRPRGPQQLTLPGMETEPRSKRHKHIPSRPPFYKPKPPAPVYSKSKFYREMGPGFKALADFYADDDINENVVSLSELKDMIREILSESSGPESKLKSDIALQLYFFLMDYLIMSPDPKYSVLTTLKNTAIKKLKDPIELESFKELFNKELGGNHTAGQTAWDYHDDTKQGMAEGVGNKALDALQLALDIAGIPPAIGTAVNGANTAISLLRAAADKETDERKKHLIDAGLNAVSMIPFGSVVKLVKLRALRKPAVAAARAVKGGARTAPRSYEPSIAENAWYDSEEEPRKKETLPMNIDHTKIVHDKRSRGFWVSPNAKLYQVGASHAEFAVRYVHPELGQGAFDGMMRDGWVRMRAHPEQKILEVESLKMTPAQQKIVDDVLKQLKYRPYITKYKRHLEETQANFDDLYKGKEFDSIPIPGTNMRMAAQKQPPPTQLKTKSKMRGFGGDQSQAQGRSPEPQDIPVDEGVGWGTMKDIKKDPKHIDDPDTGKPEHWRIKFQSAKDIKKHGTTEKSPVNESIGNVAGKTPTDPMQIVSLIMDSSTVLFFTNAGIRGPVIRTARRSGIINTAQAEFAIDVDDNKKNKRVLTRESEVEALANTIIQQKMNRYFATNDAAMQKTPGASPITEALTPKAIESIERIMKAKGTRPTAIKLVDVILAGHLMGLTSRDLADTATFANGLDAIEEALTRGDFEGAVSIARDTAEEMIRDEGGGDILGETITKTQLKEMIKGLVNEMWIGWEQQEEGAGNKKRVDPKDMAQALKFLNKVNPAAYAQLMVLPFGPVPSYAWEDPNSDWWSSEDAINMRQSIKDAQREGPKPNPKKYIPKNTYAADPPHDYAKWGDKV